MMFCVQEEKYYLGTGESFGKHWSAGDCVGVFLDLVDRTVSKYRDKSYKILSIRLVWYAEEVGSQVSSLIGCCTYLKRTYGVFKAKRPCLTG